MPKQAGMLRCINAQIYCAAPTPAYAAPQYGDKKVSLMCIHVVLGIRTVELPFMMHLGDRT
jgi:hypothetical protein